ncbi:HlyD family secretion protein [Microbulbifer hainanensis]|uniref:HlyD family secretion protein n=1 Tax=Microbulbifer hainanensis TaxID=2735675 RepID=UPI001867DB29|nr:HlyD family efflux transporter periplasmic adaptor subunit [Microbulbifer hainanensis]
MRQWFVLVALILSGCAGGGENSPKKTETPLLPPITGELESARAVQIAPPSISRMWQYSIKKMVAENAHVEKGDLVVAFDDKPVRERLIEKKAELSQARSELSNTVNKEEQKARDNTLAIEEKRAAYNKAKERAEIIDYSLSKNERMKSAIDFKIAANDLEEVKALADLHRQSSALKVSLAKRKIERLESETGQLQAEVEKLSVKAPIAGLVQYIPNWNGEKPSEGESVRFGQPVVLISDLSQMRLRATADEVDKAHLKLGEPVDVVIDGAQARTFRGTVTELGSVVRDRARGDRRRVIDLLVGLEQTTAGGLKPGMTASVNFPSADGGEAVASVEKDR